MEPLGIRINGGIYLAAGAGELRLASSDPNVQPILDYNYLQDPFDRDRLREKVRQCVQLGSGHRKSNRAWSRRSVLGRWRLTGTQLHLLKVEAREG